MFSSPDPTPEQSRLHAFKMRVFRAIEPYRNRVKQKDYNAFLIALKFSTDANQVHSLYNHWRDKLTLKLIATLPELNAKTETQTKQAA